VYRFFALALALSFATPALAGTPPQDARRAAAARIVEAAMADDTGWQRLAWLSDRIGHRLSGSPQLEAAIAWAVEEMRRDGFDDVRAEKVMVPKWVRGAESASLLAPVARDLVVLGLGNSVGTPPEGITADVVVVKDYAELDALGEKVRGKIVCYNVPFTNYGETVQYRGSGASRAARHGAVAVLVRSVGPVSLQTPHTGAMRYDEALPKIPAAAITIEGAEMLARMQARGERLQLRLKMEARFLADVESANVVADLRGSERPDEIVLVAGHFDSWDVGQGAHDDGGGCIQVWEAVRLLKKLGLRPRRTIRVVLYTNEENGLRGGVAYRDAHKAELANHVFALETDSGTFAPEGFGVTANAAAIATLRELAPLLEATGATRIAEGGGGADIGPIMREGVPGAGLDVEGSRYFHYHHTPADTLDKVDPKDLKLCTAAIAIIAYLVADLPHKLGQTP
jgi:carboxypeptidase Q